MDGQSVFGRRDRVMAQQVEGEAVLLEINSGEYFSLNEVGGMVWELCDGTRSVAQIAGAICSEFDVEQSVALHDTSDLIESLAGAGLVTER
jgi:hypothetical protein